MAGALSRRYEILVLLDSRLLGFEYVKELHAFDSDFSTIYNACESGVFNKFFRQEGYLFRENKLCVPKCSL